MAAYVVKVGDFSEMRGVIWGGMAHIGYACDMGWGLRVTKLQNPVSYLVSLERKWIELFSMSLITFKNDAIEFQPKGYECVLEYKEMNG